MTDQPPPPGAAQPQSTLGTDTDPQATAAKAKTLSGRLPTANETVLIEYAKQLVSKSVETSLDFHKTMLGVSATFGSAITTLVPILVWGDKDTKTPAGPGWLILAPALLMLLSSICFAVGYYPRHAKLNINDIEEVRRDRDSLLSRRACLASIGLLLFCGALFLLVGLVVYLRRTV